ncbi:MAG: hypothetical protein GXP25_25210 [Planctomycetes bacterium]|nr:hypothetical protein [Planctomycetota bacterium]
MYGSLHEHPEALGVYFKAHFGLMPDEMPETVVVTPHRFSSVMGANPPEALAKRGARVDVVKTAMSGFGDSYFARKRDRSALFSIGGVGGALALGHALLMTHAPRVETVLFYGTAGAVADHTGLYDMNVPDRCIRGDRVTEDVVPRNVPAEGNGSLCAEVRDRLGALLDGQRNIHADLHYTVSSIFVETDEMLQSLRAGNVNTIDMELSVYYTLLGRTGKRVAGILKAIDLPLKRMATFDAVKKNVSCEVRDGVNRAILTVLCDLCGI